MNNQWELYDDHPDFAKAEAALDHAWEEAKRLSPELLPKERARKAEAHVFGVMMSWSHVGAMDTEPRSELAYRVAKHFGVGGGWL